jgi:hypothetical protein
LDEWGRTCWIFWKFWIGKKRFIQKWWLLLKILMVRTSLPIEVLFFSKCAIGIIPNLYIHRATNSDPTKLRGDFWPIP